MLTTKRKRNLGELYDEAPLTAMQRMAAREVRKLKHLHATRNGSALFLIVVDDVVVVVAAFCSTTSSFRDILWMNAGYYYRR